MNGLSYIFGYGSLASESNLRRFLTRHGIACGTPRYARLAGFRRNWTLAHEISPPAVTARAVVYLNVYRALGHSINGLVFPVASDCLDYFDRRERDYERIDVRDDLLLPTGLRGPVWLYVASVRGLGRFDAARRRGEAIVDQAYLEEVEQAFAAMGCEAHRDYLLSTDPPAVPVARRG